jgi:hypothetical protein
LGSNIFYSRRSSFETRLDATINVFEIEAKAKKIATVPFYK